MAEFLICFAGEHGSKEFGVCGAQLSPCFFIMGRVVEDESKPKLVVIF